MDSHTAAFLSLDPRTTFNPPLVHPRRSDLADGSGTQLPSKPSAATSTSPQLTIEIPSATTSTAETMDIVPPTPTAGPTATGPWYFIFDKTFQSQFGHTIATPEDVSILSCMGVREMEWAESGGQKRRRSVEDTDHERTDDERKGTKRIRREVDSGRHYHRSLGSY